MSSLYYIAGLLLGALSTTALVVGIIILIQRMLKKDTSASICPYIGLPIAIVGIPVIIAYGLEAFIAYYGANKYEADAFHIRWLFGPYRHYYYFLFASVLLSQAFWFRPVRRSAVALGIFGFLQSISNLLDLIGSSGN